MKQLLLLITFITFCYAQGFSQGCVQSWPGTKANLSNFDTSANIPHAIEGTPYNATIQFKILTDTTYVGFHATVDWVQITGVSGFSGIPSLTPFIFTPSSAKGQFTGGQTGNIEISGTPSIESSGVYPLTINMTVYFHLSNGRQGSLNMTQNISSYKIQVDENPAFATVNRSKFDVAQNYPNPFKNTTSIIFHVPYRTVAEFAVSNLVGNVLYKKYVDAKPGVNNVPFDGSALEPGVYFYSITTGSTVITKRLIIDRN